MKTYLTLGFMLAAGATSAAELSMSDKMELRDNCGSDFRALCPGMRPGDGKLMACVKSKQDQLSKACSVTIAKMATKREE